SDQLVLTVGTVTSLIRADVYKWGMLMAGALVAAGPPLIIYAFLMDYYIARLTAGATKGRPWPPDFCAMSSNASMRSKPFEVSTSIFARANSSCLSDRPAAARARRCA